MAVRFKVIATAGVSALVVWFGWEQRIKILEEVDPHQRNVLGDLALLERVKVGHGFPEVRFVIKSTNGELSYREIYDDFPHVKMIETGVNSSGTAFFVADKLLVTAAHNFQKSDQGSEIKIVGTEQVLECEPHPCWEKDMPAWDVGRCFISEEGSSGFKVIDRESLFGDVGRDWTYEKEVAVAGFGCTSSVLGSCEPNGSSGSLNIGLLKVLGKGQHGDLPAMMVQAGPAGQRGAQVCQGDSGGPVFRLERFNNDGTAALNGIIGIASARKCPDNRPISHLTIFDQDLIKWILTGESVSCG